MLLLANRFSRHIGSACIQRTGSMSKALSNTRAWLRANVIVSTLRSKPTRRATAWFTQRLWAVKRTIPRKASRLTAADARRKDIDRRTLDAVNIDDATSEQAHGYQGESATEGYFEGRRTREARGGWFSYQLKIVPDQPITLVCAYRGSEGRRRSFDVIVDGQKVATETLEYHPTEQLDREYALPADLTRGKSQITVKFQALAPSTAGAVIDVRTLTAPR